MAATADTPAEHAVSIVPTTSSSHSRALPNEVLSIIASECDPIDLKNMRLASQLMHQIATKPFVHKEFSRRRFLFTYQSMKALVDITAHPDFGPHLTCLTFDTYRLEETPYDNDDGYNDRSARYDTKEAMHKTFINRGHHVRMLSLALENFKKCLNTGVILGVHDDVESGAVRVRGYAFEASYEEFCPQVNHMSETLKALRLARDHSGYPLTALELFLTPGSGSLEVLAKFDSPFSASSTHPGPDLDIFLEFWSTNSRWVPQSPKLRILSNFTRLVLSKHHLGRNVNREYLMSINSANYGVMWQNIESRSLQEMLIENTQADYDDLVQFLQKHKSSSRSLELDGVTIFDRSSISWALKLLRFLRFHLQLSHLSIRYLVVYQLFIVRESVPLVSEGRDSVEKELDRIITKVEWQYQDERKTGRKGFRRA